MFGGEQLGSGVLWYDQNQLTEETPWHPDRYEDDPRPGHRAPDGYVDPWGDTLYDRIGNAFGLLVFGGGREVERAFVAEAGGRGLPFTVVHLTDEPARRLYGADHVLVRPDQHVAWRGGQLPPAGAGAVLDRVLGHAAPTTTVATKGVPHVHAVR
ncbi:hypothetical protein [Micromonospora sp. HUAS LYJ1]|uniref:aromatic-ring hydroxylase C-terminal domain-containing protein n=1 Tax=Micromonospora sp. HUAS LYJ1 TaxID=3061626 RepID=UPI002672BEFF|nr:hypothetical protein [Micromonospora sp. HUAS LYJ1]WKU03384.1 hypothetical protein Q2K16_21355 [Micromonospora sp. HUAS LYJ1]